MKQCGGPSAIDVGETLSCDLGSSRSVSYVHLSVGCNDGETGTFDVTFDGGNTQRLTANCSQKHYAVGPIDAKIVRLRMVSGGGSDQHISFNCCGSTGWSVGYR